MRPSAVPNLAGETSLLVSGQMTAGTNEKLTPIIAVATHRLHWVSAITAIDKGRSNAPNASMGAYRPVRPHTHPKAGVVNMAARNT